MIERLRTLICPLALCIGLNACISADDQPDGAVGLDVPAAALDAAPRLDAAASPDATPLADARPADDAAAPLDAGATDADVADALAADATEPDAAATDAGTVTQADLPLSFDPNGLWWDEATRTLFLADETNNRVVSWTEAGGFATYAELGAVPASSGGLGQLLRLGDGRFVTPRFGFGTAGGVYVVSSDGTTTATVPNLDPVRRRVGLGVANNGTIYQAYFTRVGMGPRSGGIATLDLTTGAEPVFLDGFGKPASVLVEGMDMYVSDQDRNRIVHVPRRTPTSSTTFAQLDSPDILTWGPMGSLFSGSRVGVVYQISRSGTVTSFATGLQQPRGVAYDEAQRRLFIADHDGDTSDGTTHFLRVRPVP